MDFNQERVQTRSAYGRTFKEKLEWFYDKSTERLELNAKKFEEENSMREEENKACIRHGTESGQTHTSKSKV